MINYLKKIYFYILEIFTNSDLKAPIIETLNSDEITKTDDLSLPVHYVHLTTEYSELIKIKTNYIQFKYLVTNKNPKDLILCIEYNTYSGFGWYKKADTSPNMPINMTSVFGGGSFSKEDVAAITREKKLYAINNDFKEENTDVLVLAPTIRASDVKESKEYHLDQFEYEKADGNYYINIGSIDINPIDKIDSSVKIKIQDSPNNKGMKSYISYFTI
jgi:hypothetical protein